MKLLRDALIIFSIFALMGGIAYSQLETAEAGPKIKDKQEFQDLQNNPKVTLELIAISADGKVKFYRLVDCSAPYGITCNMCYITVGELHGKTVAMECK